MMAAGLISVLSGAVFGNVWNFKIQVFFQGLTLAVFAYSFFSSSLRGSLTIPSRAWPAAAVLPIAALSWALSPLRTLLAGEVLNFICGLCLLFSVVSIKKEIAERKWLVYIILILAALAGFFQFLSHKETYATLKNSNTMAFYAILAGGLCLEWGNYYLAFAFLVLIVVSKSAGAILALFMTAVFYAWDRKALEEFKKNPFLSAAVIILPCIALFSIDLSSVYDRLHWWKAALLMFFERPFLGWGFGSFAFAGGAFKGPSVLGSVYVHNYYLEFLAENGVIAALLWFWFLYVSLRKTSGFLRYALFAALAHGMLDFGLSTPYGFWLFCFILGLAINTEKINLPYGLLKFAMIPAFAFSLKFLFWAYENSYKENLISRAESLPQAYQALDLRLAENPDDYDLLSFRASSLLAEAKEKRDKNLLYESARTFEKKLLVNPYGLNDYIALEKIYSFLGEKEALEELRKREEKFLKWN